MNDEKVAEIVAQLSTISTEKNGLLKTNAEQEIRIKVSLNFKKVYSKIGKKNKPEF